MRGRHLAIALALAAVPGRAYSQLQPRQGSFETTLAPVPLDAAVTPAALRPMTLPTAPMRAGQRHKSPGLAWFLSYIIPGGGQAYNGQWGKAVGFFVPAVVGVAMISSDGGVVFNSGGGSTDAGLALALISSVWSQIDAPISASRINREAARPPTPAPSVTVTIATIHF